MRTQQTNNLGKGALVSRVAEWMAHNADQFSASPGLINISIQAPSPKVIETVLDNTLCNAYQVTVGDRIGHIIQASASPKTYKWVDGVRPGSDNGSPAQNNQTQEEEEEEEEITPMPASPPAVSPNPNQAKPPFAPPSANEDPWWMPGNSPPVANTPEPEPEPEPVPEKPKVKVVTEYLRPNGETYHVRDLGGKTDVETLRALRDANIYALAFGRPGTGKTALIEAAFPDLLTIAGDGDTEVADFTGQYVQREDGTYEWLDGPLVIAMQEGRVLFIDDVTLISPKTMAAVYPAMDGRRKIILKAHKGETVEAKEGFYVVGAHNPGVHGAILTDALASRFTLHFEVTTDLDLARTLGVSGKAIKVARNLTERMANEDVGWCPEQRELIAFRDVERTLGEVTAFANLIRKAPEEDLPVVLDAVRTVFGSDIEPLTLGRQV